MKYLVFNDYSATDETFVSVPDVIDYITGEVEAHEMDQYTAESSFRVWEGEEIEVNVEVGVKVRIGNA